MQNTFRQQLDQICEKCKNHMAIGYLLKSDEIEYLAYGELLQKVQNLEQNLKQLGIKKTDRVAIIISPIQPEGVIAGVTLRIWDAQQLWLNAHFRYRKFRDY